MERSFAGDGKSSKDLHVSVREAEVSRKDNITTREESAQTLNSWSKKKHNGQPLHGAEVGMGTCPALRRHQTLELTRLTLPCCWVIQKA